jgi:hypothetical protein
MERAAKLSRQNVSETPPVIVAKNVTQPPSVRVR